jgi:hypothetical protein
VSAARVATITVRPARAADADALERLAGRDSAQIPEGPLLVAERDDVILAALSLETDAFVADPFEPTADLVAMLQAHATAVPGRRGWKRRQRPQLRPAT